MRLPLITVYLVLLSGCSSGPVTPQNEPIHASWRPRAGDVFSIKMHASQEGDVSGAGTIELAGDFRVLEVLGDGSGRGTYQLLRLEARGKGEDAPNILFENGTVKEWSPGTPPESGKLASPIPMLLHPSGKLEAEKAPLPWNPAPFAALGVWLPGRYVLPGETWKGIIRAAYSDWLEVEYSFTRAEGRLRIVGRSTPKAEEEHKIVVQSEGTFLPDEGYLSEAKIDIDFSLLKSNDHRNVLYEIRRHQ